MNILSVVGARPEFIQAAPVSRVIRERHREILVHTGQHYDYRMSQAIFEQLSIPEPDYNLEVGSGSHARQTAEILIRLEEVLDEEKPDIVIVRGDTNSTLAGALAASKLHIPTAHIEAGERSYNRKMPEEINRLVADHLADIHFCACRISVSRLAKEGIEKAVFWTGDVMYDAMLQNREVAERNANVMLDLNLSPKSFALVTIHRAANTDEPNRLKKIVKSLNNTGEKIIFPVHPRTRNALKRINARFASHVHLIDPVPYFDMVVLEQHARLIATDSGGVQREAYMLGVPCITLREETEWTETVEAGWNLLVGVDPIQVLEAWTNFQPPQDRPPIFGYGDAAEKIISILEENFAPEGIRETSSRLKGDLH